MKKALLDLPPPYLTGTNRADTLVGTNAAEEATGLGGNDVITLFAGADRYGITQGNVLVLEAGNDLVDGGNSDDRLLDGSGRDTLLGGEGGDTLSGVAFAGVDLLADELYGGNGRDVLSGDNGDSLTGGGKDDTFYLTPTGAAVVIMDAKSEAQAGVDADLILIGVSGDTDLEMEAQLGFGTAANGVDQVITLGGIPVAVVKGAAGQRLNIEIAYQGVAYPTDGLVNGKLSEFYYGKSGADTIKAGLGDDFVTDGTGNDVIDLGKGDDVFYGTEDGVAGADDDNIRGGAGNDQITSWSGADLLRGDAGDDFIFSGDLIASPTGRDDKVLGGDGNDTLYGSTGDTLVGGAGLDRFETDAGFLVTVSDYVAGQDVLALQGARGATVTLQAQGKDALLLVDGVATVVLHGLTPAQFDLGDVLIL